MRDLTLVGGASGVGAPFAAMVMTGIIHESWAWSYLTAAGVAGLATGALLGALTPRFISWRLGRAPRAFFIAAGLAVGAVWGGIVGALAGVTVAPVGFMVAFSAVLAAPVGALQLGWFWLTAAQKRVRRRPVGASLAAAVVAAPALGSIVGWWLTSH
ncbi:MAG: hypothetical protein JST54_26125 [Deltaproteobacteria bacterium]|nr:hypothetical protein [Deltaproteobacteria bacterium]